MLLIFHRAPVFSCEYANWLEGYVGKVALIISEEANKPLNRNIKFVPKSERYDQIFFLNDYDNDDALRSIVEDLGRNTRISDIIAPYEFDLSRAADFRQKLGLRGQSPDSAKAFRDKLLMKQLAKDAGLINQRFAAVENWEQLADFHAQSNGKPIILKPRSGAASRGVMRVDDPIRQRSVIEESFENPLFISPDHMVEEFVEGEVHHIDGLVLEGDVRLIWPSRYITGSLDFQKQNGQTISSAMLDPNADLTARLKSYVSKLLQVLPTPENCTFHCEVFVKADATIELCEIASRTGGVRIKHAMQRAFGVDIAKACMRADLGLEQQFDRLPDSPKQLTGWATMAGCGGRVQSIPEDCNVPGVYDYQKVASVGDIVSGPRSAVDYIANCDIEGQNFDSIVSSINLARSWFYSEFSTLS
ncbi:MAG: ATP-grasp domain-containing protein [Aliishimia sp.]